MKLRNELYIALGILASSVACSKVAFTPSSDSSNLSQSTGVGGATDKSHKDTFSFNNNPYAGKVDILFVVDNSASMSPLQNNMTANFNSFMNGFIAKNFDYRLAVTTTEAYLSLPQFHNDPSMAQFRDGVAPNLSNVFNITPQILQPISTFVTNASLGSTGSGDERAFSSLKAALNSPLNAGFVRPDSFFAVVILSDEDDFSSPTRPEVSWTTTGGVTDHNYSYSGLETVDSYIGYLDNLTGSSATSRRYSVSAMAVLDSACQSSHVAAGSETSIIGQRYIEMANKTGGELGSICDNNYGTDLSNIADRVIQHILPSVTLSAMPIASTVKLIITPSDPQLTWTVSGQKIVFSKTPAVGTTVEVDYLSN